MKTWTVECNRCHTSMLVDSANKPSGPKVKCPKCGFTANGSTAKEITTK